MRAFRISKGKLYTSRSRGHGPMKSREGIACVYVVYRDKVPRRTPFFKPHEQQYTTHQDHRQVIDGAWTIFICSLVLALDYSPGIFRLKATKTQNPQLSEKNITTLPQHCCQCHKQRRRSSSELPYSFHTRLVRGWR